MGESWLRINVLSVIGASLGFVSLFFAWMQPWSNPDLPLYLAGESAFGYNITSAFLTVLILMIGSFLAFLSPLGGIVQATAVIGHVVALATGSTVSLVPFPDMIFQMPGVWLGGIAAAIALSGLFWRVALEARFRKPPSLKRLLAVARKDESITNEIAREAKPGFLAGRIFTVGRVNVLAVLGALVGVSSMTFPWLAGGWPFLPSEDMGNLVLGASRWEFIPETTYIAGIVFLAGSVVAIVTYLGAFAQLGGLVLFLAIVRNSLGEYTMSGYYAEFTSEISLGTGFFIGTASLAVICSSYALRGWLGRRLPRLSCSSRVFVWSRASKTDASPVTTTSEPGFPAYTINVLCLLGAAVGIISLLGAWAVLGPVYSRELSIGSGELLVEPMCKPQIPTVMSADLIGVCYSNLVCQIGMVIFLIGLAVSFSSQLGGGLQLSGLALLGYGIVDRYDAYSSGSAAVVLGPGYFLALASAILVIASIFVSVEFSCQKPSIHRMGRYLTITQTEKSTVTRPAGPRRLILATRSRWSFALSSKIIVVFASVVALISLFLPWATNSEMFASPWDALDNYQSDRYEGLSSTPPMVSIAIIMLCGSLLALVTPFGGFLQAFSVAWYFWEYVLPEECNPGYGYFIALVATGLTLSSVAVTVYQNRIAPAPLRWGLFMTWSVRERGSVS
jgi:hypothetical protein